MLFEPAARQLNDGSFWLISRWSARKRGRGRRGDPGPNDDQRVNATINKEKLR